MKQFPGIDCRANRERRAAREMCRYYSIRVEITGCEHSRIEEVREAVEMQWDLECCVRSWGSPAQGVLSFAGKSCLYAGERPDNFASRLCEAAWIANEGYCDVQVRATGIEGPSAGEGSYASAPEDYTDWKRTGELPSIRRIGDRRLAAVA